MRVIHAADFHLDSPLRGLAAYDTAPVEAIRTTSRRALVRLVDTVIEREAALLLIAGDVFDGDWNDYNTGLFYVQQLSRLTAAGIRVVSISGNHDAASKLTKALTLPDGVVHFGTAASETVVFDDLAIAVHGQSYAEPAERRNLAAFYPPPRTDMVNFGLLHTGLEGRTGHARYAPCTVDDLRARAYDYWALGHIHTREIVARDPWVVFAGCLQGRHINEPGAHGAVEIIIDAGNIAVVDWLDLDVARWQRVRVDVAEGIDPPTAFTEALRRAVTPETTLDLIRIETTGPAAGWPLKQLEAEARAAADRVRPEGIWIEKVVRVDTGAVAAMPTPSSDADALDQLTTLLSVAGDDPALQTIIASEIDAVLAKLPHHDLQQALLADRLHGWKNSDAELDPGFLEPTLYAIARRLKSLTG